MKMIIKGLLKRVLSPKQAEVTRSIFRTYRKKIVRKHVVITGTGRAGTTFLVQILTHLGLDTGFTRRNMQLYENANAGMETDIRKEDAPYIVKNPWFCSHAEEIIKREDVLIKHVFIPIRDLHAAAESRRQVEGAAPSNTSKVPGGLWLTDNKDDQEKILLQQSYNLMLALSGTTIPVTLLRYPRLVKDSRYLYQKLKPILGRIGYGRFCSAFKKIARPDMVHSFNERDK